MNHVQKEKALNEPFFSDELGEGKRSQNYIPNAPIATEAL